MITLFLISVIGLAAFQKAPPDSLNLEYCYTQAAENYPTARNIALQGQITDLNVRIANTGYFPDVSINGQASYQSEVTEFSLPGQEGAPAVRKDQYEASLNITQNIFNGGAVGIRKELERARGRQEVHSVKVNLQLIREQVDQIYFGILLSQQQSEANRLLIENLQEQVSAIRSRVQNGALLPSQQRILEAELINARQDSADIRSNIKAGYLVLGEIIGEPIDVNTELSLPKITLDYQSLRPQRPEYELFKSSREVLEQQEELAKTSLLPRISAFGTAAYGRPGLNFLNDNFHDYYIVGARLQWNFTDFINADWQSQALQIQQQKVNNEQRAFSLQLNASLDDIAERIASIRENIERNKEIIKLREQTVEETASQLKYGVITATEYVTELTRANQARLSLYINRVRLVQAQTDYATVLGVPLQSEKFKSKGGSNDVSN